MVLQCPQSEGLLEDDLDQLGVQYGVEPEREELLN